MLEPHIARALADSDRHVAITGASGWIGLATLDLLQRCLGPAFDARVSCFGSSARLLDLGEGRHVAQRPLADLATLTAPNICVLHLAFHGKERAETMDEAAYRAANRAIGATVVQALDRIDAGALFFASSGAAAHAEDPAAAPSLRLYGRLKREEEERFAAWGQARGHRVVIGRIFNITGPYINKLGAYAMASFILDALAGRSIEVRASRAVFRGYVAIRELMSLVLALLLDRDDGVQRFESGGAVIELGDVAAAVAFTLGAPGVMRAAITEPNADRYAGNAAAYSDLLARHRITPVPLDRQVRETARWLAPHASRPEAVAA